MAALVHVGQCGNQLGAAYWELVASSTSDGDEAPETAAVPKQASGKRRPPGSSKQQPPPLGAQLARHFFLRQSRKARCVLLDTEPKVVAAAVGSGFQPAYTHVEQSGRGNNWAMGYNFQRFQRNVLPHATTTTTTMRRATSAHPAPPTARAGDDDRRELVELAMDSLHKLVEATECFQGVVLLHSLGGGTGAGLGSRLLERIRDAYPRSYVVAASVAPSRRCGDTPLQNYNAAFTLARLQEHTDCVLYKENDELLRAAGYWKALHAAEPSGGGGSQPRISLAELNHLAAADLAGLLFPTVAAPSSARSAPVVKPFAFGGLVHDLCPLPAAKFLDVRTGVLRAAPTFGGKRARAADPLFHAGTCQLPLASTRTDGEADAVAAKLFQHTAQSFPRTSSSVSASATLACSVLVRGFSFADAARATRGFQAAADAAFPGVAWNPEHQVSVATSALPPFERLGGKASITICANNGHVLASAEHFLQRAQRQFRAGAYVHWYTQHGLEESDFLDAFETCARLTTGYRELLG